MNKVPQSLKDQWQENPAKKCCRADEGNCQGKLTKDHTITWKGRQLQEDFAIVDVCEFHHAVNKFMDCGDLNREKHIWVALNKATDQQLLDISKAIDYLALRKRLNTLYG